MGIKTVYTDDIDDSELGPDAKPVRFALEGKEYSIYLSSDNKKKLTDALDPYIKNAETGSGSSDGTTAAGNKEHVKAVRAWAQATGIKFTDAKGVTKVVGDKGRIPDEIFAAYAEAN